jgi:chromosome segregation ATPase
MTKRATRRKKTIPAPTPEPALSVEAQATPAAEAVESASGKSPGHDLLADLEQRCDALRRWHDDATTKLETRQGELDAYAEQLQAQRQDLAVQRQVLENDAEQLADARTSLIDDRTQVLSLREELDAEWASVKQLRLAIEKIGKELDRERERQNRQAFKFSAAKRAA